MPEVSPGPPSRETAPAARPQLRAAADEVVRREQVVLVDVLEALPGDAFDAACRRLDPLEVTAGP